jgi:hypothetical protein
LFGHNIDLNSPMRKTFSQAFPVGISIALSLTVQAAPTKQWSQGDPSGEEQYALEVINRIRRDPVAAANFYIGQAVFYPAIAEAINQRAYSNHPGVQAMQEWIKQGTDAYNSDTTSQRTPTPKGPLCLYPLFTDQARKQGASILDGTYYRPPFPPYFNPTNFFNTTRADGRLAGTPVDRESGGSLASFPSYTGPNATGGVATTRTQTSSFRPGETLYLVNQFWSSQYNCMMTLRETFLIGGVGQIFLDDSFTQTNSVPGKTRMTGISLGAQRTSGLGVGSRILSVYQTDMEAFQTTDLPFGVDTVFITGVIYRDRDKDGDYTSGEGVAGVTISPNNGEWFAVTSTSGGYAIPVRKGSGVYTVNANGNGVNTSNVVTVENDSVKLDFVLPSDAAKPAQVPVASSDGITQFLSLSTRGVAEAGENALIGGFAITGPANVKKNLLIRGVAQTLYESYGLTGVLRKPLLTVFDSNSKVILRVQTQDVYNQVDGYVKNSLQAAFAQVQAFPLVRQFNGGQATPDGPNGDTAALISLNPGLYSVSIAPDPETRPTPQNTVATSSDPNSGLVLLEIYDMSPTDGTRLVSLSSRGKIEQGARQMIAGFSLSGSGSRRLLVRGIGPALKSFGVISALDDSVIKLYDAKSSVLVSNDDWGISTWADQTVISGLATGAFSLPDSSLDGVILTRAPAGLYSAGVTSATGQTGVGLAEIYEN